jgi:hypothetical protein
MGVWLGAASGSYGGSIEYYLLTSTTGAGGAGGGVVVLYGDANMGGGSNKESGLDSSSGAPCSRSRVWC